MSASSALGWVAVGEMVADMVWVEEKGCGWKSWYVADAGVLGEIWCLGLRDECLKRWQWRNN